MLIWWKILHLPTKFFGIQEICSVDGSGDGSLTHFFVNPLDDSVAYSRESGQLANPNPIYKSSIKNLIAVFARKSLNLRDIRYKGMAAAFLLHQIVQQDS